MIALPRRAIGVIVTAGYPACGFKAVDIVWKADQVKFASIASLLSSRQVAMQPHGTHAKRHANQTMQNITSNVGGFEI